jgi:hypothetical protein
LKDCAVYEEIDWENRYYGISFFIMDSSDITIDGEPYNLSVKKRSFSEIDISSNNCSVLFTGTGTFNSDKNQETITINLDVARK